MSTENTETKIVMLARKLDSFLKLFHVGVPSLDSIIHKILWLVVVFVFLTALFFFADTCIDFWIDKIHAFYGWVATMMQHLTGAVPTTTGGDQLGMINDPMLSNTLTGPVHRF